MKKEEHHNEKELEELIQSKLDDELKCKQFPMLCAKSSDEQGRKKVVELVKYLIFTERICDIDACFVHIESSLGETDSD